MPPPVRPWLTAEHAEIAEIGLAAVSPLVMVWNMAQLVIGTLGLIAVFVVLLVIQGRVVRARTPILAEAPPPHEGTVPGPEPGLSLIVLGDSTAAGVGASSHDEGLAGHTARAVARVLNRKVHWRVVGKSGARAKTVRVELLPSLSGVRADAVVLAVGVNEVTALNSTRNWIADLRSVIRAIRVEMGEVPILLCGVPPMNTFPTLPQPLRAVLGWRSATLDRAAARLARSEDNLTHVRMTIHDVSAFASDGFHPGPVGYATWGAEIGRVLGGMVDGVRLGQNT